MVLVELEKAFDKTGRHKPFVLLINTGLEYAEGLISNTRKDQLSGNKFEGYEKEAVSYGCDKDVHYLYYFFNLFIQNTLHEITAKCRTRIKI